MLNVVSTSDVSLSTLRQVRDDLSAVLPVAVDEKQYFAKSGGGPSWVVILAELPWWLKVFGPIATVYVYGLTQETAKATWRTIATTFSREKAEKFERLAAEIASLRSQLGERTSIKVGAPTPNQYISTRLTLQGQDEDSLAIEFYLFVHHVPALRKLIEDRELSKQVAAGIFLTLEENGDLSVWWQDRDTFERKSARLEAVVRADDTNSATQDHDPDLQR